ncbi:HNH endonuclease [Acinetobacter baumannii]|nr:HNH endonuclease [Acinetobacter baumannii]
MPVSRGGGDEVENLQTLCRVCNARKGTNLEMERTKA